MHVGITLLLITTLEDCAIAHTREIVGPFLFTHTISPAIICFMLHKSNILWVFT